MLKLAVIVLLVNYPATWADTCDNCKSAYGTPAVGKKCAALKTYLTCLEGSGKGDHGCPLAADDAKVIQTDFAADSCTFTDTCICQKDFWKTDQSATGKADTCSAYKTELSCLRTAQSSGCDGNTTKSATGTAAETARAALGASDCPGLSDTCQCEVDAAKGDASTSAKYCTVLATLKTCLSAITDTTEVGCTTLTQEALVNDTTTKITAAICGSYADHVTYTMTSLIVPVLVHLFM